MGLIPASHQQIQLWGWGTFCRLLLQGWEQRPSFILRSLHLGDVWVCVQTSPAAGLQHGEKPSKAKPQHDQGNPIPETPPRDPLLGTPSPASHPQDPIPGIPFL